MAFKMKNPSLGQKARSAGSPHKFGIEHKGVDSAARETKAEDFGVEGSAMKFKKIGSKIKEKLAERKSENYTRARDPDAAARGEKIKHQNIAETGVTEAKRSRRKLKEYQVDTKGDVKSMKKEKVRGVGDKAKFVTKEVDASGKKTKIIRDAEGKIIKEKKPRQRKALDKTVKGKAAEKKVAKERKVDDKKIAKKNKPIVEENKAVDAYNEAERIAYEKELARLQEEEGYVTVETGESTPTKMKKKSAFKVDEGEEIKSTTLIKKGETTTIPGTEDKKDPIKPSVTPEQKKAYADWCAKNPEKCKERNEPTPPKTTTTPDKKVTITQKKKDKKELIKAKREEGKMNKLKAPGSRKKIRICDKKCRDSIKRKLQRTAEKCKPGSLLKECANAGKSLKKKYAKKRNKGRLW